MNRTSILLISLLSLACRRVPLPSRGQTAPPEHAQDAPQATAPRGPIGTAVDPPAPPAGFRETARFLPQGAPVSGWQQSGSVRIVNGRELFQLIDGAGEKYLSYGFRQLGRTDYRRVGTELVVTAEIYDMSSPLGAFGQYSMLLSDARDPATMQSRAVNLGGGGFLGTSQLVFWRGQYLVQLNLADDSGDQDEVSLGATARDVLPALAMVLASVIPGDVAPPSGASILPRDGLVWSGATYLSNEVLGVDQSGSGWVGHYRATGGARYRLAVLTRSSEAEAHAVFLRFRGAGGTPIPDVGDEAGATSSFAVARSGQHVVVVGPPSTEALPALSAAGRVERLRAIIATLN